jgi:hypothetical protein
MGTRHRQDNNAQEIGQASEDFMSIIKSAMAEVVESSEQGTDTELETMSPVKSDFYTKLTNGKRHLRSSIAADEQLDLDVPDDMKHLTSFGDDKTYYMYLRWKALIYESRGAQMKTTVYPLKEDSTETAEEAATRKTLSEFQWPQDSEDSGEI